MNRTTNTADAEISAMFQRAHQGQTRPVGVIVPMKDARKLLDLEHYKQMEVPRVLLWISYGALFLAGLFKGMIEPVYAAALAAPSLIWFVLWLSGRSNG